MNTIFALLSLQALMGAFDNLWHHEWQARLPQRRGARKELALHAAREAIYGVVFIGLAWLEWQGGFAALLAILLGLELVITLADFLEEDRTRRLPPFERLLHTLLTISYGLFLGLFGPILWQWAQQPTGLVAVQHGWVSALFTLYGIGVLAWSVRNALAVRRLGRMPVGPAAPPVQRIEPAILITGASGFLGSALARKLQAEGRRLILLSRDGRALQAEQGAGLWVVEHLDAIPSETRIEAIVHLAGARVLGRPWTATRRQTLLESRVGLTCDLLALMRRLAQPPRVLVAASAVGYYGAVNDSRPCPETAPAQPEQFQSALCAAVEHEARRAEGLGLRVVRLRFGVVLGREDGAYPMLALSSRLGLGAVLGTGCQPAPWIHLEDAIGLIHHALATPSLQGAVNAVAPHGVDQAAFSSALATSFDRPRWLRVPAWPLRVFAGEMSTLLLDGQFAVPDKALASGYRYAFPCLETALADLAHAPPTPLPISA